MKSRFGIIKLTIVVALLLCTTVAVGSLLIRSSGGGPQIVGSDAVTFAVFEGEFVSSVNEVGDIESADNVEIRCRVKSRGRDGSTILELIPEGSVVKAGDFLCQLDDSLLREELTERRIQVAKDNASVIQASSLLESARRKLNEYEQGNFAQELNQLIAAVNVAKEKEKRAAEIALNSAKLSRKGYLTRSQLQADVFAAKAAKEELDLAEEERRIYEKFSKARIMAELQSEIEQQEAILQASKYTLELSKQREAEYEKQVAECRIVAPQGGTLVYANDSDRRDSSIVIEEGATIRDGQPIFYLPDPNDMQVNTKVNDSKINKVKAGQRVEVRVDTDPETPIAGVVRRVSPFPLPRRYYQAPIEYEVFVDITEKSRLVRGGLRAKVEIFVETKADVIQAPVSSLVLNGSDYFVLVKSQTGIEPRKVEVGSNNESFVIINNGVQAGENVLVDADNYRDQIEFPASS